MSRKAGAVLVVGDLLLRGFLVLGLIGLPLFFTEWLDWWSANGWLRTLLFAWLFIFGMGLFLVAVCVAIALVLVPFLLVDLWVSLLLACLGLRSAMQHFHHTCSLVGDLLIALGRPLKSFELSFPLDGVVGDPEAQRGSEAFKELRAKLTKPSR